MISSLGLPFSNFASKLFNKVFTGILYVESQTIGAEPYTLTFFMLHLLWLQTDVLWPATVCIVLAPVSI